MGAGHPVRVLPEGNPVVVYAADAIGLDLFGLYIAFQVLVLEARKVCGNPLAGVVAEGDEQYALRVQKAVGFQLPHAAPCEFQGCLNGILRLYFQHQHTGRFCPLMKVLVKRWKGFPVRETRSQKFPVSTCVNVDSV